MRGRAENEHVARLVADAQRREAVDAIDRRRTLFAGSMRFAVILSVLALLGWGGPWVAGVWVALAGVGVSDLAHIYWHRYRLHHPPRRWRR